MKKISLNYWNTLKPFEQEYIHLRAHKDTIQDLKTRINTARKLYPNYTGIYGKGFINLPDGSVRVWSGYDTKKFHLVKPDGLIDFVN